MVISSHKKIGKNNKKSEDLI